MKAANSPLRNTKLIPTGIESIDELLGGGMYMRRIFQLSGRYSVGKSSLAALIVAQAQKMGYDAAWIDAENRFNFEYFAALGIDLEKLDYTNGGVAEEYFKFVHEWFEKHSGVLVLDSVAALLTQNEQDKEEAPSVPEVPKMLPTFLKKVTNELAALKKENALIFINQERQDFNGALKVIGGRSVEHYVTQWLRMRKLTAPGQQIMKSGHRVADKIEISAMKDAAQYNFCVVELWPSLGFKEEKKKV